MTNKIKLTILHTALVLCVAIIVWLGYSTWALRDKINQLENGQASIDSPVAPFMSPMPTRDKH